MKFPFLHFIFLAVHGYLCYFVAMLLSIVFPLYPLFFYYIAVLLPCSFITAFLFAQLSFDGGRGF